MFFVSWGGVVTVGWLVVGSVVVGVMVVIEGSEVVASLVGLTDVVYCKMNNCLYCRLNYS